MLRPSTVLQPSTAVRLSSTALWPPPTAPQPQFASRGPYIPCSIPDLHFGLISPLPSIPLPHSFANTISHPLTRLSPKLQLKPSQQRPNAQSKHSRASPVRAAPTAKGQGCTLSTTNTYTPFKDCLGKVLVQPNHNSDARKWGNSKGKAEVNGQYMKGIEVAAEPEEVKVPYACPHPVQLTTIQGSANGELVTAPAKTLSLSTSLWFTSTASQYTSTTPYIPSNNTPIPPHGIYQVLAPFHQHPSSLSPCAPARDFHHYPASFYSRPSLPFSSKHRCSSLLPCFRQLINTRNEHLNMPPSRVAPQIGHKGCMLSLTPHMPYSPPWTNQPSPGMQNEQVPEVPTLLSVLTADSIRSPSSMIPCGQFITNSDDDVQLLPTRGRGEEMDEYGHDHWSLSDESNRKSRCRSLGSRASSYGPQISSSFNRSAGGHIRTPLSLTSASTSFNNLGRGFPLVALPPYSSGRSSSQPCSCAQAQLIKNFVYDEYGQPLPDNNNHALGTRRSDSGALVDSVSSLPTSCANGNGDGSDSEDSTLGLVTGCSMTSSTVSLEPLDGLDALQRPNVDLNRMCMGIGCVWKLNRCYSRSPCTTSRQSLLHHTTSASTQPLFIHAHLCLLLQSDNVPPSHLRTNRGRSS